MEKRVNPCLATVLVGDNPASATYVRNKHKACDEVGILTKDLKKICLESDIIITGVGNREIFKLTPDMVKDGAIVIDVATTRHEGKLSGDADYSEIIEKASFASPVPGGVGPMTVAMLLKNTVTAAALSRGIDIKRMYQN